MIFFEADGRDNFFNTPFGAVNSCGVCCQANAQAIPGETNRWRIDYGMWMAPLPNPRFEMPIVFSFEKLTDNPPPSGSVLPPTNVDYSEQIAANTAYNGTVSTSAVSPSSLGLTFAIDPLNVAQHGFVAMNADGTFIYSPNPGFVGLDRFYFVTMDGINDPVKNSFTFGVDTVITSHFSPTLPAGVVNLTGSESGIQVYETNIPPAGDLLYIPPQSVYARHRSVDFALVCDPEALIGQLYRMSIKTQVADCNRTMYSHISRYDIEITQCGRG